MDQIGAPYGAVVVAGDLVVAGCVAGGSGGGCGALLETFHFTVSR
jgi:hypothetical protein